MLFGEGGTWSRAGFQERITIQENSGSHLHNAVKFCGLSEAWGTSSTIHDCMYEVYSEEIAEQPDETTDVPRKFQLVLILSDRTCFGVCGS